VVSWTTGNAYTTKTTQPHVAIAHNWKRIPPVNKPIHISERNALTCCGRFICPGSAAPPRQGRCKGQLRCHAAYWSVQVFQVLHRGVAPRPRFSPLCFSAQPEKTAFKTLAYATFRNCLDELGKAQCFFTLARLLKYSSYAFSISNPCLLLCG
jgi:hypothetical protein